MQQRRRKNLAYVVNVVLVWDDDYHYCNSINISYSSLTERALLEQILQEIKEIKEKLNVK
jgi:predicted neutral ceramidase superfamily lipid hydrolase